MTDQHVSDMVVGQERIRKEVFGGRHWTTVLKMIYEDGYPVTFEYGRWQCSRSQCEMHHRRLQEARSQKR